HGAWGCFSFFCLSLFSAAGRADGHVDSCGDNSRTSGERQKTYGRFFGRFFGKKMRFRPIFPPSASLSFSSRTPSTSCEDGKSGAFPGRGRFFEGGATGPFHAQP